VAYDPKGRYVVSAGKDRTLRVWDVESRRMRLEIHGTRAAATAVAVDGTRDIIISGGSDNVVRFFDAASGGKLRECGVRGTVGTVDDIVVESNGVMVLVSGGPFGATSIRPHGVNIETAGPLDLSYIAAKNEAIGASIAQSADGKTLALGGDAGVLTVWTQGVLARRSTGHTSEINGVAIAPTGETIATAGADGTVRLWDTTTGDQIGLLEGHSKPVNDVAFSPDGAWLVSVGSDRKTRQWRPSRPEPEPSPEPEPVVVVPTPPATPDVRLDPADVTLRDGDGDRALSADEHGFIDVVVRNAGAGVASGYQLAISPDTLPDLVYDHQTPVADVPASGLVTLSVPVRATPHVANRTRVLDVLIRAADGVVVASAPLRLSTLERKEPDLVVADYSTAHANGAQIGATTTVNVTVRNRGSGLAEDVIILAVVEGGPEVAPQPSPTQFARGRNGILVGDLAPTDFADAWFSLTLPRTFVGIDLPMRIVAQEATGAFGADQSVVLPVWDAPSASLVVAEAQLQDADMDGALVPEEPASLRVRVVNEGSVRASRVRVIVRPPGLPGLTYMASIFAGELAAGARSVVTIPIAAVADVEPADRTISLVAVDAGGNESAPVDVTFTTRPSSAPDLRVASVLIDGAHDGSVVPGGSHTIEVSVANDGSGDADGVRVTVAASAGGDAAELASTGVSEPAIRAGANASYTFNYASPATLNVDAVALSVSVGEGRAGYGVADYLTVGVRRPEPRPGKTHVLLAGVNRYANHADLVNPVGDTRAIAAELEDAYGASVEALVDPTRRDFLAALYALADRVYAENDELLVMFSGHGWYDDRQKRGFLAFSDSADLVSDPLYDTYVPHETVRTVLERLDCNHVLLIVDSCFSGTLDPSIAIAAGGRPVADPAGLVPRAEYVRRKLQYRTRRYITAGGREYVPDGRPGHHSPFVRQMLEALRSYGGGDGILTFEEMLLYLGRVTPEPRAGELYGNEPGSSFVFVAQSDEPAAEAPARKVGTVVVSVFPADADIAIQGAPEALSGLLRRLVAVPVSKTRRYRLPVGVYRLRVSRDGYVTDERELRVDAGTNNVTVTLSDQ
ncbi:hypothetical protein HOI71_27370, partial [Candidatus Poribacteria bacterium]|nr:hypothetical protein [Candidatus Poribacteria bacterium]